MPTAADIRSEISSQYEVGTTGKWKKMFASCSHKAGAKNTDAPSEEAGEIMKTFEERLGHLNWPTYELVQSWFSESYTPTWLRYPDYSEIVEATRQLLTDFPELRTGADQRATSRLLDSLANLWSALDDYEAEHSVITYTKLTLERYVLALYGRELKRDDQSRLEVERQAVELWEAPDDDLIIPTLIYVASCICMVASAASRPG